jgi:hypothetical protein
MHCSFALTGDKQQLCMGERDRMDGVADLRSLPAGKFTCSCALLMRRLASTATANCTEKEMNVRKKQRRGRPGGCSALSAGMSTYPLSVAQKNVEQRGQRGKCVVL